LPTFATAGIIDAPTKGKIHISQTFIAFPSNPTIPTILSFNLQNNTMQFADISPHSIGFDQCDPSQCSHSHQVPPPKLILGRRVLLLTGTSLPSEARAAVGIGNTEASPSNIL
jgi:hypothetical protein